MSDFTLDNLLSPEGPICLIVKAQFEPVGEVARFQPAGFPEIGHVLYDAPKTGNTTDKVCFVDSSASMANHLESVCMAGPNETSLHPDLQGLPFVRCVTDRNLKQDRDQIIQDPKDPRDKTVCTSLSEGHRIASDYFLDGLINPQWRQEEKGKKKGGKEETIPAHWEGIIFRDQLRAEFDIIEVKKDKTYFIHPEDWWKIYQTIFKYDPNSLVHGVMFAKEQIKISRFLTAHLEAFGAARVGRSGVKFDRLGKTLSGQPIFAVDEETAREIVATFILDLALLRSYGRNGNGLNDHQKKLILGLGLWKIRQLLARPFRFRSQCFLRCTEINMIAEGDLNVRTEKQIDSGSKPDELPRTIEPPAEHPVVPAIVKQLKISDLIRACNLQGNAITDVYYPVNELFKSGKEEEAKENVDTDEEEEDAGV